MRLTRPSPSTRIRPPWVAAVAGPAIPFALALLFSLPGPATGAQGAGQAPQPARSPSPEASAPEAASAAAILGRARASLEAVRDAQARIEAESLDARGRRVRSVLVAWMLRSPAILRVEVLEPSMLAQQVYVIDRQQQTMKVYLPVTHQVVVQNLAQAMENSQLPMAVELDQVLGMLAKLDDRRVTLRGTERQDGRPHHVLEFSTADLVGPQAAPSLNPSPPGQAASRLPPQASFVRVWVDGSTWLPDRVVAYESSGHAIASVELTEVTINTGLQAQQLRRLPDDAEVVGG